LPVRKRGSPLRQHAIRRFALLGLNAPRNYRLPEFVSRAILKWLRRVASVLRTDFLMG
jgi:hypothetical protein